MQPKILWAHNSQFVFLTVEVCNASDPGLQVLDAEVAALAWTVPSGSDGGKERPFSIELPLLRRVAAAGHQIIARPRALCVRLQRAPEDREDWPMLQSPSHSSVARYLGDVQIDWDRYACESD